VVEVFVAAIALFVARNFEIVTMAFRGFSARALLVAIVYSLGMATGGSLQALVTPVSSWVKVCGDAVAVSAGSSSGAVLSEISPSTESIRRPC
jgi:hypothetical protein